MAQWAKLPDNSYVALNHVDRLTVGSQDGTQWFIVIELDDRRAFNVRGPFADAATAQAALDSAIANNLGGSF